MEEELKNLEDDLYSNYYDKEIKHEFDDEEIVRKDKNELKINRL